MPPLPTSPQTYRRIVKVDLIFPPHVSPEAKDFVTRLLKKDPKQRMPLERVKTHPWIVKHLSAIAAAGAGGGGGGAAAAM